MDNKRFASDMEKSDMVRNTQEEKSLESCVPDRVKIMSYDYASSCRTTILLHVVRS